MNIITRSWKSTQSIWLLKNINYINLTGNVKRWNKRNTVLGQKISSIINSGNLVSDEVVGDIIEKHVSNEKFKNRLIFDGYPRNLAQARNLDIVLKKNKQKISCVLKLSVSLETIKKRIIERKNLEKRSDDNIEIAIKRFSNYENNIRPLVNYYKQSIYYKKLMEKHLLMK